MESKAHEDFQPRFDLLKEKDDATVSIKVHFPGFIRKEELKVQLIGKPTPHKLWISGERTSGSDKKWWTFKEEFPVPADCDTDAITAKLENGILWVTLPRKTPGAKKQEETSESAQKKAQEQTNTFLASTKVAPPEPKALQPQNPTDGDVKEGREKASSEVVRGSSDPPSQTQGSNKRAEERESSEPKTPLVNGKAVSEEVPKPEEPKSLTPQTIKREGYDSTCLEMNLRRHEKTLNLALVVLAAIGIGLYVKKIYDY